MMERANIKLAIDMLDGMEDDAQIAAHCIGTLEDCGNEIAHLRAKVAELETALREAKEALVMNIVGTGGRTPAAHNAIATINKVLGEE